ncbi:MAG: DUF2147 domain-containing protein [Thermoanaerobaculaceae bacterium]
MRRPKLLEKNIVPFLCGGLILLVASVADTVDSTPKPEGVLGLWQTPPNPDDGAAIVEISKTGEGLSGKIVWLEKPVYGPKHPASGQAKTDRNNPDPSLRARPILGLVILSGFRWEGSKWVDGSVYDPISGKTYRATLYLEAPERLRLRGYVGIPLFGRSEVWMRVPALPEFPAPLADAPGEVPHLSAVFCDPGKV